MLNGILRILGIALIALGCLTIIRPEVFTEAYGLGLPTEASRSVIRGLIGGSEIGLGLVQLLHSRLRLDARTLGVVAAFLIGGVALVRLISMVVFSGWNLAGGVEFGLEAICLMLLIVALRRETNGLSESDEK